MEYVGIEEARGLSGLRLVLTAGVPGPWGEAAKAVLHVKEIPYTAVRQVPGESEEALLAWTAQTSAPVAIYEDEHPRSGWADILYLAERLAPQPPLLPVDPGQRMLAFGLTNEIAGENGFAWQRRMMMLHPMLSGGGASGVPALLGEKYGYSPEAGEAASRRVGEILGTLSGQLRRQQDAGSPYLVGDALSVADLYWATFAAMVEPLPDEQCPMNPFMRQGYQLSDPALSASADPLLLEHRDFVYREHLTLPLDF